MFPTLPSFGKLSRLTDPFRRVQTGLQRAQEGLYHGAMKQYGNNVPFSKKKTRRTWLPNVQPKRLHSPTLGRTIRLRITARALKTVKKYNGLDNYLLNTRADLLGEYGVQLRGKIQQIQRERELQKSGPAKLERLRFDALEAHWKHLERVRSGKRPTLHDAHTDRISAGEALGLDGPASPKATIRWLKEQEKERHNLLKDHPKLKKFFVAGSSA